MRKQPISNNEVYLRRKNMGKKNGGAIYICPRGMLKRTSTPPGLKMNVIFPVYSYSGTISNKKNRKVRRMVTQIFYEVIDVFKKYGFEIPREEKR